MIQTLWKQHFILSVKEATYIIKKNQVIIILNLTIKNHSTRENENKNFHQNKSFNHINRNFQNNYQQRSFVQRPHNFIPRPHYNDNQRPNYHNGQNFNNQRPNYHNNQNFNNRNVQPRQPNNIPQQNKPEPMEVDSSGQTRRNQNVEQEIPNENFPLLASETTCYHM